LEQRGIKEAIIFGNLPYYITSPIFRKVVENQKYFPVGVFMIQKEVADKIKTNTEKKSYLWWLVNYYYKVEYLFSVPPKAFRPAPKVVSAVVRLVRRNKFPDIDYDKMVYWLDMISGYKRKTLGKIFKILVKEGKLSQDDIVGPKDLLKKRLEELDFKDLKALFLTKLKK
jgi:16S rRNA (adenine1518-N6/adenine1519-N6)-dimethyltransferase